MFCPELLFVGIQITDEGEVTTDEQGERAVLRERRPGLPGTCAFRALSPAGSSPQKRGLPLSTMVNVLEMY